MANKPLHIKILLKVLDKIKEEAAHQPWELAKELIKVGAALTVAQAGSLRGPEVFQLDLAGIRNHIQAGRDGVLLDKPLDPGTDLFNAPYIYIALILVAPVLFLHVLKLFKRTSSRTCPGRVRDVSGTCPGGTPHFAISKEDTGHLISE